MTANTVERQQSKPDVLFGRIAKLVKGNINDSDAYWERRNKGATPPNAIRETALDVAQDKDTNLSEADRSLLTVVGNLGTYVQAQDRLDAIYDHYNGNYIPESDYKEIRELKGELIIPFNHILKDFINTHPNDEIRATSVAFANTYEKLFARFDCLDSTKEAAPYDISPDYVVEKIQAALDGMRHEVAAETILEAADYSYDYKVSAQEDAHGADLFVYLESGWEAVDIKAAQSGVERSRKKNRMSRAVTTGLGWNDFTGTKGTGRETLSIPFSTAEQKAPYFIAELYDMAERVEAQRQTTVRRAGRQGIRAAR